MIRSMRQLRSIMARATVATTLTLAFALASPGASHSSELPAYRNSVIALDGSALPQGITAADGPDATVWFSAAQRSAIGEIDVASGAVGYIGLGHGAKPRALTRCSNGKIYALDPALNIIHEITPSTEDVTRHPMPGGQVADLTGAVCTSSNQVFFTGYNGVLGKLDTSTGQVTLGEAQGGRGPSQIVLSPSGSIWFSSYASNQIVRVDPVSMKQDAFAMPAGVEGPKSLVVDTSGRVWVSAFRSARIARFDPRRRTWDAWSLGEGARPHAVLLDANGAILVSDVGRDRLLRFDAATGSSSVIATLSERGQARSMVRLGEQVWLTESAADRIRVIDMTSPTTN
jgi:virginiamycin B lyase